jgi:hypothetical protein
MVSIGFSVFMFGIAIFYGMQVGAYEREYNRVDRFRHLAKQEWEIRTYRKNLDLPNEPPNWMTGLSSKD